MSEVQDFVTANARELSSGPASAHGFAPDALMAAAAHVSREYGMTGYRLYPVGASFGGAGLFEVGHSDGSRFRLYVDRWGNVARVPDGAPA